MICWVCYIEILSCASALVSVWGLHYGHNIVVIFSNSAQMGISCKNNDHDEVSDGHSWGVVLKKLLEMP